MPKRERGTEGLMKIKGCRYWYAQIYVVRGKQRRYSTKTTVKQEAEGRGFDPHRPYQPSHLLRMT
jgi:hypothetical protein